MAPLVEDGRIAVLGVVQEQHPDRARLELAVAHAGAAELEGGGVCHAESGPNAGTESKRAAPIPR